MIGTESAKSSLVNSLLIKGITENGGPYKFIDLWCQACWRPAWQQLCSGQRIRQRWVFTGPFSCVRKGPCSSSCTALFYFRRLVRVAPEAELERWRLLSQGFVSARVTSSQATKVVKKCQSLLYTSPDK